MKSLIFVLVLLLGATHFCFAQTNAEAGLKKAEDLAAEDKIPEAVAELTAAINLQPDNAALYLRRAKMYSFSGDIEAVRKDVNQAVSLNPNDKETILTAARFLRNARKCDESLSLLDQYVQRQKADGDIFYARSHSKMCLGDWSGAYEDMYAASELTPPDAPLSNHYRTTLAGMLAKIGDSDQALEQLGKLIKFYHAKFMQQGVERGKFNPSQTLAEVYRIRAGVYHARKDEAAEFADLAKAVEYAPLDFNYRIRAKIYADHGKFDEAVADYTQALKNTLNPAIFLFERGQIYYAMKKYDEAVSDFNEAVKKDASFKDSTEQYLSLIKQKNK